MTTRKNTTKTAAAPTTTDTAAKILERQRARSARVLLKRRRAKSGTVSYDAASGPLRAPECRQVASR